MLSRHVIITLLVSSSAVAEPPPDAAAIKKAWKKHCYDCHGADGRGRPVKAKMLKVDPRLLDMTRPDNFGKTRAELYKVLVDGKDAMPGFKSKLKQPMMDAMMELSVQIIDNAKKTAGYRPKS